jgi:hypothetical protein
MAKYAVETKLYLIEIDLRYTGMIGNYIVN